MTERGRLESNLCAAAIDLANAEGDADYDSARSHLVRAAELLRSEAQLEKARTQARKAHQRYVKAKRGKLKIA